MVESHRTRALYFLGITGICLLLAVPAFAYADSRHYCNTMGLVQEVVVHSEVPNDDYSGIRMGSGDSLRYYLGGDCNGTYWINIGIVKRYTAYPGSQYIGEKKFYYEYSQPGGTYYVEMFGSPQAMYTPVSFRFYSSTPLNSTGSWYADVTENYNSTNYLVHYSNSYIGTYWPSHFNFICAGIKAIGSARWGALWINNAMYKNTYNGPTWYPWPTSMQSPYSTDTINQPAYARGSVANWGTGEAGVN